MRAIVSNKIGSHIHSPFVYRLVANVLFAPYPFYTFEKIKKLSTNKSQQEKYQLIFRLVNFFQPQSINMVGQNEDLLKDVCQWAKKDIDITFFNEYINSDSFKPKSYYMILWHNYSSKGIRLPEKNAKQVWIIRNINNKTINSDFELLANSQEVSITLRLKQFGIVIFNDRYQKENYVIIH